MKVFLSLLISLFLAAPLYAQPRITDQARYQDELGTAFAPLKELNQEQLNAVAGLVLAARAGLSVQDYCPPLKQFAAAPRMPCEGAMISYARARANCKKAEPNWKECPKLLEAEANWAACETKVLGERLRALKLVTHWPKPAPQPRPVSR